MAKKCLKFIKNFSAAVFLSGLGFVKYCQAASTQSELQKQLNVSGIKGWGSQASPTSMPRMIQYVISAFLGLLGIIFLVLIIYAGFGWMTAQGDEEKVTKAKDTLTHAIIGLVIITAAYSITYFVFSSLPDGGEGTPANPVINTE